jgi:hypothetical protein
VSSRSSSPGDSPLERVNPEVRGAGSRRACRVTHRSGSARGRPRVRSHAAGDGRPARECALPARARDRLRRVRRRGGRRDPVVGAHAGDAQSGHGDPARGPVRRRLERLRRCTAREFPRPTAASSNSAPASGSHAATSPSASGPPAAAARSLAARRRSGPTWPARASRLRRCPTRALTSWSGSRAYATPACSTSRSFARRRSASSLAPARPPPDQHRALTWPASARRPPRPRARPSAAAHERTRPGSRVAPTKMRLTGRLRRCGGRGRRGCLSRRVNRRRGGDAVCHVRR